MKKRFNRISIIFLVLVLVIGSSTMSFACTSIFAGKDATTDDSVLISRNEDYTGAWAKHFYVFERETHEAGETETFYNDLEVTLPLTSYKYFALRDWDPSYGPFNEAGINEKGVAISATNTSKIRDEVLNVDPLLDNGIGETHIPTLVLSRAENARQAVELFGAMIDEHGSMEGYGFAIADEDEVWYMEVASGHHWAAVRIPDNKYLVVANQFRLKDIDFEDDINYITSKGLNAFVYDNNLLEEGETFDFAKAFGILGNKYNTRREWWGQKTFNPSIVQNAELDRYPVFMTPDEKINPKEVMDFLGSDYEGTQYNTDTESGKDERAVGIHKTVESHVIQLRQDMPTELSGIMWLSMANPEYGIYLPFYTGLEKTIDPYHKGTDAYDNESAYWAFRGAATLAAQDEELYGKGVKEYWNNYQNSLFEEIAKLDTIAMKIYEYDKELAIDFITEINNIYAEDAIKKAKQIQKDIITNLADHNDTPYTPSF